MINRNFEQEPTNTGNSRINEIVNRDREHKRFTANPINVYEKCFHQPQDELLQGAVLNIGDPFRVIARTHPDKNILTVDYYFPTPAEVFGDKVPERIRELDKITTDRCLEGPFPEATGQLPDRSFDRILAHAAMSMHSFEVYEDNEFRDLWQEAVRLLKEGGRFYIGPVQSDYGGAFDDQMVSTNIIPTLEVLAKSGLIEYRIVYGVHPYKNPSGDYQDGWVAESPDCIVIEKLGEDGECGLDDLFSAEKYEEVDNFGYSKRITPIVQLNL